MDSQTAYSLIAMLLVLASVGLLALRVQTPYPVLLVIGGLCLTVVPHIQPPQLDPNLILLFFLPPLLYKEAFHTSWHDFRRWLRPIVMLAVGLVAVTILAVAGLTHYFFPNLPWPVCFILGAVVSPTDTIAVTAVLHRIRVPRRLTAIIGGESLLNDATGLVALQLAIGVAASGTFSWLDIGVQFTWTVVAGVGIGLLVGLATHFANRFVKDPTLLFTFSLVAPYVAFAGAHAVHASGVLAVVTAGFFVAWRIHTIAADTRHQLYTVWRLLAYLIDGFSFVLIGCALPRLFGGELTFEPGDVLIAGVIITVAVVLVRVAWIFSAAYLPIPFFMAIRRREGGNPPVSSVILASWCGIRGAVSLAAALSVPITLSGAPFPGRDIVIACTVCVILGTLIVQGMTLQPLIRLLGIRDETQTEEEGRLARISMIEAALSRLDELRKDQGADVVQIDHVENDYLERLKLLSIGRTKEQRAAAAPHLYAIELEALLAERRRVLTLRDESAINDMTQAHLQEELDIDEMRLRAAARLERSI